MLSILSFMLFVAGVASAQISEDDFNAAGSNDAQTLFKIGYKYEKGTGVEQDYCKAAEWYAKAVDKGHKKAASYLANLYLNGYGVVKDRDKAIELFLIAAESGFSYAQYWTAQLLYNEKKYEQAFGWALKSAKQGSTLGIHLLAKMYKDGLGTAKDVNEAIKWHRKGAEKDYLFDILDLAELLYNEKQFTEALKWYKVVVEKHEIEHYKLALMYYRGEGCAKNYSEALRLFTVSANKQNDKAMNYLGYMYEHGLGCIANHHKAFEWYEKSAHWGNYVAQRNLGLCYKKGVGTDTDSEEAEKWLKQSEDTKISIPIYNEACKYEYGRGVEKNLDKAKELYEVAASKKHMKSCMHLGGIYRQSDELEDLKTSLSWYEKARELGYLSPYVDKGIDEVREKISLISSSEVTTSAPSVHVSGPPASGSVNALSTFDLQHTSVNGVPATLMVGPLYDTYDTPSSSSSPSSRTSRSSAREHSQKVSKQADITSRAYESFKKDPTGSNARYYNSNKNLLNTMQKK